MPGGGSILGMIISLRNNSNAKIRVQKMLKENQRLIRGLKKDLDFKEISEEELKTIKQEINRRARQQRKIQILVAIPLILVLIAISSLFWVGMKKEMHQEELLQLEQKKLDDEEKYDKYMSELNKGYKWLAQEKYKAAKFHFSNANKLGPNAYTTQVAISTAYMYDCIKNQVDCDTVHDLLSDLDAKYKDKKEVIDLMDYYTNNKELFTETNTP